MASLNDPTPTDDAAMENYALSSNDPDEDGCIKKTGELVLLVIAVLSALALLRV